MKFRPPPIHLLRSYLEFWFALMGLIVIAYLVTIAMRGRRIPECFSCGAMKVRPSRATGILDTVGAWFLIRPYRCGGCQHRFRAFRFEGSKTRLKVIFQFRDGFRVAIRSID